MTLKEHFKMDYKKILPLGSSVIKGKTYRFTILSPLLVRLEYSLTGEFEDRPTELVMNRNFPAVKFEQKEDSKYLTIKTEYFTITYQKEQPLLGSKVSPDQYLRIDLNDTDKYWYVNHPEVRNFGGTTYSLDGADGKTRFGKGLYSTDGFTSIDDSNSLIYNEDGSLGKRNDKRMDIYVFMYKRDFGAALRDYFTLTGFPPLVPRYALGVWWNRNIPYNSKDIEKLVFQFNKYKIPLSILMLGDDWHKKNGKMKSGLSFNLELIKRPKRVAEFLHSKNVRLALKINPIEGISNKEDYYLPFKKASGLEEDKNGVLPFNVFNPNTLNAYFDYLIHPLMNYGVDFFWLNYDNVNDLTTLRALTHYHFNDFKQILNRRGITFARTSGLAQHRYPVIYTGETLVSWNNLKMMPQYNSTASNLGLSWISNDIGGFTGGIEDPELYARFVQFGCFSPILRLSADEGKYYKREPWRWDITTSSIVSQYLRLRHSLIPYLYSEAYRYSRAGLPLVQPLYYRYPEIYDEPLYRNEYYFGSNLLVAPITTKSEQVMDRTILRLFLPEGIWYDFTNGKRYNGGKRYTAFYKREDYPVFAKQGTIIPLAMLDEKNLNDTKPPKNMEIQVFPGASSTYEMYEDDGLSSLYEKGFFIVTDIDYTYQKNNFNVTIRPVAGKSGIIPDYRAYRIRFRNTKEPDSISVHCGTEKVKGIQTFVDDNDFVVDLPSLSTIKQITVVCKGKDIEIDALRLVNDDIDSILNDLPIQTKIKEEIGKVLLSDSEIKQKRIAVRKLSKLGVSNKYINLFLKLLEYMAEV
jgi:alpha-glucosidase (family GH31 glycosyl hydrolase)